MEKCNFETEIVCNKEHKVFAINQRSKDLGDKSVFFRLEDLEWLRSQLDKVEKTLGGII